MPGAPSRFTVAAYTRRGLPALLRGAFERGAQLVGELGLETAQECFERTVGPVVQQAAQPQARNMREAAREHLGPSLDGCALRLAETFEIFFHEPLDAFERRAPIALLQRAEQRAVIAFR